MTDAYASCATPSGITAPTVEQFRRLATGRRVIPVTRRFLVDDQTPVGLYRKLAGGRPGTFLLESAENGQTWSRYSFIGVRSAAMLTEQGGQVSWVGNCPVGLPTAGPAAEALRDSLESLRTPRPAGLPPLTGGLVGYLAYDAVRWWERIPDANPDELGLPEIAMLLATDLAVMDHADGSVWLVANAVNYDNTDERVDRAYANALERLDRMETDLHRATGAAVTAVLPASRPQPTANARFRAGVEVAKEYIRSGDAFQIVLSQRFRRPCPADPLDVYRALRMTNPSPYMYLLNIPGPGGMDEAGFSIVGSSPEALVKLSGDEAMLHPIAGTRPRGATPDEDAELVADLLADPKERAEHLMLVDLGRNDLGRVCRAGTVNVVEFMQVEQYSHVHHIVSTVVGRLREGINAYELLAATFPAGTLSGAPKVRAMEIIDELEPVRRGLYGGCIGYFDFTGDMDTAIAIRTAVLSDGVAHVQAGAGIVADSDPVAEDLECQNKAAAVIRALGVAEEMS
ncbi:MAG TPA: anthranilate synthase component I [Actinomycetota bacterium]|nr:anthranilate synthase component I [Actinomycetota bacterium]